MDLRFVAARLRGGAWRIAFAGGVDRDVAARAGSFLFAVAGVLGLLTFLFSGGSDLAGGATLVTSVSAIALGAGLWSRGARVSAAGYQLLAASAAVLASAAACFGGSEGWVNGFYFFWIALFVAYFFTPAAVVLQTAVVAAAYTAAVLANGTIHHPGLVVFLTVATVAVAAGVVAVLRGRLERGLRAEQERVERLLELDRLKDDLIATVSHELRTPVSAVYGAAETLRARDLPASQRDEVLTIVHQQSFRLFELVDNLLTTAAIRRGVFTVDLREIDPLLVAVEAVEATRARDPTRPIRLDASPDLPNVVADAARLHQALAAVLDNALKYAPAGTPVEVLLTLSGDRVLVSVTDRGPGIPQSQRERVFEDFYRLDPEMHSGIGGTGLGLTIVRGLMERMGGDVWIDSTTPSDRGASLVLALPRAERGASSPGCSSTSFAQTRRSVKSAITCSQS